MIFGHSQNTIAANREVVMAHWEKRTTVVANIVYIVAAISGTAISIQDSIAVQPFWKSILLWELLLLLSLGVLLILSSWRLARLERRLATIEEASG